MEASLTQSKARNSRGGQAFRNDCTAPSDPLQSCGRHTDPRSETALLPSSPRATTSRDVGAGWLERRSFPKSAGRASEPPLPSRVVRRTDTKANGVTQNAARAYDEGRGENEGVAITPTPAESSGSCDRRRDTRGLPGYALSGGEKKTKLATRHCRARNVGAAARTRARPLGAQASCRRLRRPWALPPPFPAGPPFSPTSPLACMVNKVFPNGHPVTHARPTHLAASPWPNSADPTVFVRLASDRGPKAAIPGRDRSRSAQERRASERVPAPSTCLRVVGRPRRGRTLAAGPVAREPSPVRRTTSIRASAAVSGSHSSSRTRPPPPPFTTRRDSPRSRAHTRTTARATVAAAECHRFTNNLER
ncbi:hypothetical protein HPB48_010521 [Haemaphysalis longicornis]|uniref:Uncharacterized protein n=1 Tax=Haemaphysalis longicornis TaxID=44386 RepID=A0A9J6GT58_HAELO|nr:hypothetical protein HPB48_010521 [Haemaphysalis longicornis]